MITARRCPAAAASLSDRQTGSTVTVDAASLASRFPDIDTSKHVVMEVKEANLSAKLAAVHTKCKAWLNMRQPQILAETEAKKKAEASSASRSLLLTQSPLMPLWTL
jgi:hypothetical protein